MSLLSEAVKHAQYDPNGPLYQELESVNEAIYFGLDQRDWEGLSSKQWFDANQNRFIFDLQRIEASKTPYETNNFDYSEGVYFLFDEEGLLYVGISVRICERLRQHTKRFHFTHQSAIWVPKQYMERIEHYYIRTLRPEANVKCTGGWPK